MKHLFYSTQSADTCILQIKNSSVTDYPWNWLKAYFGILGDNNQLFFHTLRGNKLTLQKYRGYSNALAPIFYGKIYRKEEKTIIEGEFHIYWFAKIFMTIWFVAVLFTMGGMFIAALRELFATLSVDSNLLLGLFFPIIFISSGVGMVVWGKRMGKKEEIAILNFIKDRCSAKPMDS